jgi:hypothetical protein
MMVLHICMIDADLLLHVFLCSRLASWEELDGRETLDTELLADRAMCIRVHLQHIRKHRADHAVCTEHASSVLCLHLLTAI